MLDKTAQLTRVQSAKNRNANQKQSNRKSNSTRNNKSNKENNREIILTKKESNMNSKGKSNRATSRAHAKGEVPTKTKTEANAEGKPQAKAKAERRSKCKSNSKRKSKSKRNIKSKINAKGSQVLERSGGCAEKPGLSSTTPGAQNTSQVSRAIGRHDPKSGKTEGRSQGCLTKDGAAGQECVGPQSPTEVQGRIQREIIK